MSRGQSVMSWGQSIMSWGQSCNDFKRLQL